MKKVIIRMLGVYLDTLALVSPSRAAKEGFLLFCRPMRLRTNEKQHTFFNSAEKFGLQHEGVAVQGYRWGNGPKKILFLHGWQSHTYRWKTYIESLSKADYTIFSIDAPGHGLSAGNFLTVPLYSALIEKFISDHEGFHAVVGHSLGGFSLMHAFYRDPGLPVDRIILLAPPGEADDFISSFKKTLGISSRTTKLVVEHFASRYHVSPGFFSARRFAQRLKVKGLIIHDEDDQEAPYHYSVKLQDAWPHSQLVTTKGFGHNLKSANVVKEVVSFIEEPVHAGSAL